MDLKKNDLELNTISNENKNINSEKEKKFKENTSEEDVYFYIMTLQADGQRHQIKIFENSNASELAFNFCKTYNLDFQTMKYLKKCIKQIILHFNTARKNEMIYFLKDNSSIQEVAEEEIITDNSLKKSSIYKKNNSNNININSDENVKIKKNLSKENIHAIKSDNQNNNNSIKKKENINENKNTIIIQKENNEKENNKKFNKNKNIIEEDDNIELKEYSIDYCLENESVEVFPPTEHTTKIEQKSSIKNSYSLNQKKNCELQDKKKNSKNKKLQINHNTINYNRVNKNQNCLFNLNKTKKEKNKNSEIINNDLKSILMQYKDVKVKEKSKTRSKTKSRSKSKSKEKKYEFEKDRYFIKKKNYLKYNKEYKSLERLKIKANNKTTFIDNKKHDISKQLTNNQINNYSKLNKQDKILSNMNELKNKYFSNYYDYFIKTKNIYNNLSKNGLNQNYSSINQDSNRSKSISQKKINKNLTQVSRKNKIKKEIKINHLNTLNYQNVNNNFNLNLNSILKKESYSKEKQRTVFKNKIKNKYKIICNKNSNIFNKTINGQCLTSRTKIKNINGKELFMESKKINSHGIKKMVTESLLNIHRLKEPIKDKKRKNIYINGSIIKGLNNRNSNTRSRNSCNKDIFSKNDSNIENSVNLQEKLYFESGNININNNNYNKLIMRNKRNTTDINLIKKI